MQQNEFLGLRFFPGGKEDLRAEIRQLAEAHDYSYMITPNADIVVRSFDGDIPREIVESARVLVCDSRVLATLARGVGKHLSCYPGSDLMYDLLATKAVSHLTLGVFGPSRAQFDELCRLYPEQRFTFIDAPMGLVIGSEAWKAAVMRCVAADWDLLWACISSPKAERLISDLAKFGRDRGLAMGAGAGVDFLTGHQRRAPRLFQVLAMEWVFRLLSNPKRMWRRYLVNCPKVLGHYLKLEILPRLTAARPEGR